MTRAISYNPVLQYMSHLVFSFKNIKKNVLNLEKNADQLRGYT